MSLQENTKLWKIGGSTVIVIPSKILNDSTYPFTNQEDDINIEIKNKTLIITKK